MGKKILKEVLDYVKVVLIAVVLATLISTQVFTFSQVQQRSMENTLVENDAIFIKKLTLPFYAPQRGEIIVLLEGIEVNNSFLGKIERLYQDMYNKFKHIENENRLVKRVIGIAGDEIDIRNGRVYRNGVELIEPYVTSETFPRSVEVPLVVPKDQILVMGDNREVSQDGREFGCIDLDHVEGIAVFRIFPLRKFGKIDKFDK